MKKIKSLKKAKSAISKAEKVYKQRKRNIHSESYQSVMSSFGSRVDILRRIFLARVKNTAANCQCGRNFSDLENFTPVSKKPAFACQCGRKYYPLKGTRFENCKIDLTRVIQMFYLLFNFKNGISTASIQRFTNEKRYETILNIRYRLSDWIGDFIFNLPFNASDSIIEVDEVYPYVQTGMGPFFKWKKSIHSERCICVVSFVEREGITKSFVLEEKNMATMRILFNRWAPKENRYFTDESKFYNFMLPDGYSRFAVPHKERFEKDGIHINGVEGLNSYIKNLFHYELKGVTAEKIQKYLNVISFNRSFKDKTTTECLDMLFDSLPGFDSTLVIDITNNDQGQSKNHNGDESWVA